MLRFATLLLISLNLFAEDVVPVGYNGKSILLYAKGEYVYLRDCEGQYNMIYNRTDCKAKYERKLMTVTNFRNLIKARIVPLLKTTKHEALKGSANSFEHNSIPLTEKQINENEMQIKKINDYKNLNSEAAIDINELKSLKEIKLKIENQKKYKPIIDEQIEIAIKKITNQNSLSVGSNDLNSLNGEIIEKIKTLFMGTNYPVCSIETTQDKENGKSLIISGPDRYEWRCANDLKTASEIQKAENECHDQLMKFYDNSNNPCFNPPFGEMVPVVTDQDTIIGTGLRSTDKVPHLGIPPKKGIESKGAEN